MEKLNSNNIVKYLYDCGVLDQKEMLGTKVFVKPTLFSREGLISFAVKSPDKKYFYIEQALDRNQSSNLVLRSMNFNDFLVYSYNIIALKNIIPVLEHFSKDDLITVHKYCQNSVDLDNYFKVHKTVPSEVSCKIGESLAVIHWQTATNQNIYNYFINNAEYEFPYFKYLLNNLTADRLITDIYSEANNFIYYYQNSGELRDRIDELLSSSCRMCLTNNNIKFSSIIFNEIYDKELGENLNIKFNNWGNCSWGDPAYDVGSVISSYLLLWLRSIILHPSLSLNKSLDLALTPLSEVQISIAYMMKSYLDISSDLLLTYPDFFKKSVQYTGLSLINQLMHGIQSFNGFNDNDYFILKTAAKLLCEPEKMLPTIFCF